MRFAAQDANPVMDLQSTVYTNCAGLNGHKRFAIIVSRMVNMCNIGLGYKENLRASLIFTHLDMFTYVLP